MTVYDRIKELADKKRVSLRQVAFDLGLGETYLYQLRKKPPNGANLEKLADYFNVSVDYLLGREEMPVVKEPVDLADLVDESKVDWDEWVSFDGKPLTDEVKSALKLILGKRLED